MPILRMPNRVASRVAECSEFLYLQGMRRVVVIVVAGVLLAAGGLPGRPAEAKVLSVPKARAALQRQFDRWDLPDRITRCGRKTRRRVDCIAVAAFEGTVETGPLKGTPIDIPVSYRWYVIRRRGRTLIRWPGY